MASEITPIEPALSAIQEMAEILREEGDLPRVDALERVHQLLSEVTSMEDQRRVARVVLSLYGGMGSFQDVPFNPMSGREGRRGRYFDLEHQLFELATEML